MGGGYDTPPKSGARSAAPAAKHSAPPTPAARVVGRPAISHDVASAVMTAAVDVVREQRALLIHDVPAPYLGALWMLHAAATRHSNEHALSPTESLALIDTATTTLAPAIAVIEETPEDKGWLDEHWRPAIAELVARTQVEQAQDRVARTVLSGGKAIEVPDDKHPREQGALLRTTIASALPTIATVNEAAILSQHHDIWHEASAAYKGSGHGDAKIGAGTLVELQNTLIVANALLTLTDPEFAQHLNHVQSTFAGVSSYVELVATVTKLTAGTLGVVTSLAGVLMTAVNEPACATACFGAARGIGLTLGPVIAGFEVVSSVITLLNPHSTTGQRVDAAVEGVSAGAMLYGHFAAESVAATASGAGVALALGYGELKLVTSTFNEASAGITMSFMSRAFEVLQQDGSAIASIANDLAKAGALLAAETDPERAATMKLVRDNLLRRLKAAIDLLLGDLGPHTANRRDEVLPGIYPILVEAFAPVFARRSATTPEQLIECATIALNRICWALQNADAIAEATMNHETLAETAQDIEAADASE